MTRSRKPLLITVIGLLLSLCLHAGLLFADTPKPFSDLPSNPLYYPAIEVFQKQNIIIGDTMGGVPTGYLRPLDHLQRDEFTKVAVIVRLLEEGNTQLLNLALNPFTLKLNTLLQPYYKVTSSNGAIPFKDILEKDENCAANPSGCNPWHTEFINFASSRGMIKGYTEDSTFRPANPILRIHALKLTIAQDGNLPADQDPKVIRITNDPRLEGRAVRCLVGTEKYILANNGGNTQDAFNLLAYVMQADRLDIFGNRCQAFTEAGAYTPAQRATFLQQPLRRQEIARYFSLTTLIPQLQIDPSADPTVDTKNEYIAPVDTEIKEEEDPLARLKEEGELRANIIPTEEGFLVQIVYMNRPPSEMTIAQQAAASKQGRCCPTMNLDASCKTINFPDYSISETADYNWETYKGPVWHLATGRGGNCWVPYPDILNGYNTPAPNTETKVVSATKMIAKTVKSISYHSKDCNVIMSCEPIITYKTVYEPGVCGKNMSCDPAQKEVSGLVFGATDTSGGGAGGGGGGSWGSTQINTAPNGFETNLSTRALNNSWLAPEYTTFNTSWYFLAKTHNFSVNQMENVGNSVKEIAVETDKVIMNGFNRLPPVLSIPLQTIRTNYNLSKGATMGAVGMVDGLFQIYSDPTGTLRGIYTILELDYNFYRDPVGMIIGTNPASAQYQALTEAVKVGLADYAITSISSRDKLEENVGRLFFEVGSFFVGLGEVKTVARTAEVTRIVSTTEKATEAIRLLETVDDFAVIARGLEAVENTQKIQAIISEMTDLGRVVGIMTKMKPEKAAGVIEGLSEARTLAILNEMHIEEAAKILSISENVEQTAALLKAMKDPLSEAKSAFFNLESTQRTIHGRLAEYESKVIDTDLRNKLLKIAKEFDADLEWNGATLFKEPERIAEKAFMDYGGDVTQVQDFFRTRYIIRAENAHDSNYLTRLQNRVEEVVGKFSRTAKNNFEVPTANTNYRNLLMNPQLAPGYPIEIQVTVAELVKSNDATHLFTEATRKFDTIKELSGDVKLLVEKYGAVPTKMEEIRALIKRMEEMAKEINNKAWEATNKSIK